MTNKRIGTREQLERALDTIVANAGAEVALAATNVSTGEEIGRDADRSMSTASVFKLPLLVEVFRQAEEGSLDLDDRIEFRADQVVMGSGILRDFRPGLRPTVYDLAMMMTIVSDNSATNMLLDLVGGYDRVNATMRDLGLPSITLKRRIQRGEITTNRSLSEATPRDLMRLMVMLSRQELISPAVSRAMRDILGRQRYLEQAPRYIAYRRDAGDDGTSQPIHIYNKTGMMSGMRADTGLIAVSPDVEIAYSVVNDAGADTTFREEHPGDITNALIGRVLLEYWWPGEWNPSVAVFASPYVDQLLDAAGL
jgi:beta-lactamase class A